MRKREDDRPEAAMERMTDDPTAQFFADLSKRTMRLPAKTHAKVRIDLDRDGETDHWFLTFDASHVQVSREGNDAKVAMRTQKELFDRIVTGKTNLISALYRNEIAFEGRLVCLAYIRAALPDQPDAVDPRVLARQAADLKEADGGRN